MSLKRYLKWEYIKRFLDVFQVFVVVIGVGFSAYQINDIANNQLSRKNQLSLLYYDRLNSGSNRKISMAIEHHNPILKKFTSDEIDDFLNDLNDVGFNLARNLLDSDSTCANFSDLTEKAYKNQEIQKYLIDARKHNEDYFQGFDQLFEFIQTCNVSKTRG
ncbi:hypothetical protein FJY93_01405 [Candidatus Kaiserbacteria bacterium]|nr:hypothetical protein [Candidatus Kaiserbacteria bacterium]